MKMNAAKEFFPPFKAILYAMNILNDDDDKYIMKIMAGMLMAMSVRTTMTMMTTTMIIVVISDHLMHWVYTHNML